MSHDDHKKLIQAVNKNDIDEVKRMLTYVDPNQNGSEALHTAARLGDIEIVKLLLPLSNPKANGSESLFQAAKHGHLDIVKLLLPLSDPEANHHLAQRGAAAGGNLDIVKLIFSVTELDTKYGAGLCEAVSCKHYFVVEFLLSVSESHADWGLSFITAANHGSIDILKLFLPRSTKDLRNEALSWAIEGDQFSTIDFLYPLCDVDFVLQKFEKRVEISHGLEYLKKIMQAEQTKVFLMDHIENNKPPAPSKKM